MKQNRKKTNAKKLRRDDRRKLGCKLTIEQQTRLRDYAVSVGAVGTAFAIERMRGGVTVQEAQVFLALADLELAQRRGPDYVH